MAYLQWTFENHGYRRNTRTPASDRHRKIAATKSNFEEVPQETWPSITSHIRRGVAPICSASVGDGPKRSWKQNLRNLIGSQSDPMFLRAQRAKTIPQITSICFCRCGSVPEDGVMVPGSPSTVERTSRRHRMFPEHDRRHLKQIYCTFTVLITNKFI